MRNTEHERQLTAALARERTLAELTGALAAELDERLVLELAVRHAARLLDAPRARVWLVEPDGSLRCAAAHDGRGQRAVGRTLPADSVGGLVARGETLVLDDISAHPAFHKLGPGKLGSIRAYLGTPIRRAGVPLGTIEVLAEVSRRFEAEDADLLRVLADAVAVAVANARSHRAMRAEIAERQRAESELRRMAELRRRLLDLSRTLLGTLSLDEVVERILRGLGDVLPYDTAGIYLLDEAASVLRPRRVVGADRVAPHLETWGIPLGHGIIGTVGQSGRGELVNDAQDDPRSAYPPGVEPGREHLISLPIRAQGRTAAVLNVARRGEATFSPTELELVELFASHASIAFEHARLFEELRASEAKYRALFDRSRDAVFICSADGFFVDVNDACAEMLGYGSRDEMIGLDVRRDVYADEREVTLLRRTLVRDGYVRDFPTLIRRKDGSVIRTVQTTTAERAADGTLLRFWGVGRDVTETYRAEQALRDAERRQQQGDKLRSLGQMASGIAHDLNQQLGLVVGHGELALRDLDRSPPDIASAADSLRTVVRAAIDGSETVKRLLSFSRGQAEGPPERVDLAALLDEVAKLTAPRWRDAAQLEGRPISLTVESAGDTAVDGWPVELREVFANLVLNAIDALPDGGSIRLSARRADDVVEAVVEDDGTGMPPEVRARIWEPFYSTKGEGGTGLGLSIVRDIVERHRARIAVDSAPGRGTRFTLSFAPAIRATAPAAAPDEPTRAASLRVLAVDDEQDLRAMMSRVLEQAGHRVAEAASGEEALEKLRAEHFDLVISDVGMGAGMNGWELAEAVRTGWPGVRFVLATGWGAQIDPAEAAAKGIQAVVSKPYRIAHLLRAARGEEPTG